MTYYRRLTYSEAEPVILKCSQLLQLYATKLEYSEDYTEAYLYAAHPDPQIHLEVCTSLSQLLYLDYCYLSPIDDNTKIVILKESSNGPVPTVSKSHIRLPKLSYLISLAPEDFFAIFTLLSKARTTQAGDALSLNFAEANLTDLPSQLRPLFSLLRTNYRMNPDYCDRKWTSRAILPTISSLDSTYENQLSAMQYLTAIQNPDIPFFPTTAAINLNLDNLNEISASYVRLAQPGAL